LNPRPKKNIASVYKLIPIYSARTALNCMVFRLLRSVDNRQTAPRLVFTLRSQSRKQPKNAYHPGLSKDRRAVRECGTNWTERTIVSDDSAAKGHNAVSCVTYCIDTCVLNLFFERGSSSACSLSKFTFRRGLSPPDLAADCTKIKPILQVLLDHFPIQIPLVDYLSFHFRLRLPHQTFSLTNHIMVVVYFDHGELQ